MQLFENIQSKYIAVENAIIDELKIGPRTIAELHCTVNETFGDFYLQDFNAVINAMQQRKLIAPCYKVERNHQAVYQYTIKENGIKLDEENFNSAYQELIEQSGKNVFVPFNDCDLQEILSRESEYFDSGETLPSGISLPELNEPEHWIASEGLLTKTLHVDFTSNSLQGFKHYRNKRHVLIPKVSEDREFLANEACQNTDLSGLMLPSGSTVPDAPKGYIWQASKNKIRLTKVSLKETALES